MIDDIIENRRIVITCGTGGVGKTTSAAALALEAARRGRNVAVVTIDPAKRLAGTLGLDELTNTPREIDRARWDPARRGTQQGRLSALMLDTKTTFDELVTANAEDPEQAQRILDNRFYRNISGALSGTQEYMATEKLYELHTDGGYDLVVVDTPPTRHALDFLDAPERLMQLLDNPIFRVLMAPTRAGLRIAGFAVQAFLRTVARVVGREVIEDVIAFLRAFEGMEEGFRSRAEGVRALLADPATAFVLVTSPRREAVAEAVFFADELEKHDHSVDALIVNRVHPLFGEANADGLRKRAMSIAEQATGDGSPRDSAAVRLSALYENLSDLSGLAAKERRQVAGAAERVRSGEVAYVPLLPHDVCDFDSLHEVCRRLFDHDHGDDVAADHDDATDAGFEAGGTTGGR
ncbi:MAG: ArsA-related P-loop ATPase [Acidimicrobiia bacterium]